MIAMFRALAACALAAAPLLAAADEPQRRPGAEIAAEIGAEIGADIGGDMGGDARSAGQGDAGETDPQAGRRAPSPESALGDLAACLDRRSRDGEPLGLCVQEAHADCLALPAGEPAGTLCLRDAKDRWAALIRARMDEIAAGAPEEIAAIAGIELKYTLRRQLMECDRIEELTLLRRDPGPGTVYARALCEASAAGLSYVSLMARSGALPRP